jgi:hypothetical protein
MTIEATVAGDGCKLVLRVSGYERPQLDSGADANWLQGEVELVTAGGAFRARQGVSLRTEELAAFRDQLAGLVETLNGEAVLEHMEEELGCTIKLKSGVGELEAFVREHVGGDMRVTEVRVDQSYLQRSLGEMNALVTSFPVKGEPLG